jgi:hypothetical protein
MLAGLLALSPSAAAVVAAAARWRHLACDRRPDPGKIEDLELEKVPGCRQRRRGKPAKIRSSAAGVKLCRFLVFLSPRSSSWWCCPLASVSASSTSPNKGLDRLGPNFQMLPGKMNVVKVSITSMGN